MRLGHIRGANKPEIGILADVTIATMLLSIHLRFLWQVMRINHKLATPI